eukprot:scaffold66611_cov65-Phaeocystis_antarctica.AAC.3
MTATQLRRAERRAASGVVERRRRRLKVAQLAAVAVAVTVAVRDAEHVAARDVGVVRAAEGEVVAVALGVVREGVLDGRVAEPHGGQRRSRVLGEYRAVEREHPSLLCGVDRLSLLPAPLPLLLVGLLAVLLVSLGLLHVPATAALMLVRQVAAAAQAPVAAEVEVKAALAVAVAAAAAAVVAAQARLQARRRSSAATTWAPTPCRRLPSLSSRYLARDGQQPTDHSLESIT